MSREVDERIVEMQFNNAQFERGVSQSMSTLEKLKNSLNFSGAEKGFEKLNEASNNVDFDILGRSVELVGKKFSALETIAVGALLRIGNKAVDAGEKLLKSLTIDQISAGWSKYESKMAAVQTMMAATANQFEDTGTQMDYVTEQLAKVNWFTDETSYKYMDLVGTMSKFTNAGVSLDDAATSMVGIANAAALAGVDANTASHAFEGFAKAIGSNMSSNTWMFLKTARMDTVQLKTTFMEAARELGTLTKKGDQYYTKTNKSKQVGIDNFESTLSDKWLTGDVIKKGLSVFGAFSEELYKATEETGVATTTLLGYIDDYANGTLDVEKALKKVHIEMGDTSMTAGEFEDMLKSLSKEEYQLGRQSFKAAQETKTLSDAIGYVVEAVSTGFMTTFEIIFGNYREAVSLFSELSERLYEVFVAPGEKRNDLLKEGLRMTGASEFEDYIQNMIGGERKLEDVLRRTAGGWLYLSDSADQSTEFAINHLHRMQKSGLDVATYIYNLTGASKEQIEELRKMGIASNYASEEFTDLVNAISGGREEIAYTVIELMKANEILGRDLLISAFWNMWDGIETLVSKIKEAFREFFPETTAEQVYDFAKGVFVLTERFKEFFALDEDGNPINDTFNDIKNTFSGLFAILDMVKQAFKAVIQVAKPFAEIFWEIVKAVFGITGTFGEFLVEIDNTIKRTGVFSKIAEKIVEIIYTIKDAVLNLGKTVKDKLNLPSIKDIFNSFLKLFNLLAENIAVPGLELVSTILGAISKKIHGLIEFIAGTSLGGQNFFSELWDLIKKIGGDALTLIADTIRSITEAISKADFSQLSSIFNAFSSFFTFQLTKYIRNVGALFEDIPWLIESASRNQISEAILKFAEAVLVLAVAASVMASVDSERLLASTGAVMALVYSLSEVMEKMSIISGPSSKGIDSLFQAFSTSRTMKAASTSMIKMAGAVLILAVALKLLSGLDLKQIGTGLLGLAGCMFILEKLLKSMQVDKNTSIKGGGTLIAASVALLVLARTLKSIAAIPAEDMLKSIGGLAAITLSLILLLKTMTHEEKTFVKGAGSALVASVAVGVLAGVVKMLSTMNTEELKTGLIGLGGAVAAIVVIFKTMQSDGTKMVKGAAQLLIASLALTVFAKNMKIVGTMTDDQVQVALFALGAGMAVLAIGLNAIQGTTKGSLALLIAASALLVLTPALKTLGEMSFEQVTQGLIAIAAAFAIFGVAGFLLTPVISNVERLSKAIALVTGVITALVAALAAFDIGRALKKIASATKSVVSPLKQMGKIMNLEWLKSLAMIIPEIVGAFIVGIANSIGEVAAAAVMMVETFLDAFISAVPKLAETVKVLIFQICDTAIDCVPKIIETVKTIYPYIREFFLEILPTVVDDVLTFLITIVNGLAVRMPELITATVNLFASFFATLSEEISKLGEEHLIGLLEAVGAITTFLLAMAGFSLIGPAAIEGVLFFGIIVGEIAGILALLGELMKIDGIVDSIRQGTEILSEVGTTIGEFIGKLVGGVLSSLSSTLPQIGEDLSNFMTNVKGFIDGSSEIKSETLDGVKSLVEIISMLTKAELVNALTSWITGGTSFAEFGAELVPFGEALSAYSNAIVGINPRAITQSADAGKALTSMFESLPKDGGLAGLFKGTSDITAFGENITALGQAFVDYSDTIKDFDSASVIKSTDAGNAFNKMVNNIPTEGGLVGWFMGDRDVQKFSDGLVEFGKALVSYSKEVKDLDVDSIDKSDAAGRIVADMSKALPREGGVAGWFLGDRDMKEFGSQLVEFGKSIAEYGNTVTDLNVDSVSQSKAAGEIVADMSKALPREGGAVSWFMGDRDMEEFGRQLVEFGKGLAAYSESVLDINLDAINTSVTAGKALADLSDEMPRYGGIINAFAGIESMTRFGIDLEAFGKSLVAYGNSVANLNIESIDIAVEATNKVLDLLNGIGEIDATNMSKFNSILSDIALSGMLTFTDVFSNCDEMVDVSIGAFFTYVDMAALGRQSYLETRFNLIGERCINAFVIGMKSKYQEGLWAIEGFASKILEKAQEVFDINSPSKKFEEIGKYLDEGLAKGISDNSEVTIVAISELGLAILTAIQEKLGIASPSRVMRDEVGNYIVEGVADGIKANTSAEEAAKKKAQNIVNAFKEELSKLSSQGNTFDLEYQLWEKTGGKNASDKDKNTKKLELLQKKIALQKESVALDYAKYQAMVNKFGSSSTEARDAYQELLNAKISLADLADSYNEAFTSVSEGNQQAFSNYVKYIDESKDLLIKAGYTAEQVEEAAKRFTGYDEDAYWASLNKSDMLDAQALIDEAMANVSVILSDGASKQAVSSAVAISDAGTIVGTSFGSGIQNGATQAVTTGLNTIIDSSAKSISAQTETWRSASSQLVDSFVSGISEHTGRAADAAANMAKTAYDAAIDAIVKASQPNTTAMVALYTAGLSMQSGAWEAAGAVLVDGFIFGLDTNKAKVADAGSAIASDGSDAIRNGYDQWKSAGEYLVDGFVEGIQSSIQRAAQAAAEMAMSTYMAAMAAIGGGAAVSSTGPVFTVDNDMPERDFTFNIDVTVDNANFAASSRIEKASTTTAVAADDSTKAPSYVFNQNNYFPEEPDATTMYRQSKNLLAQRAKAVRS